MLRWLMNTELALLSQNSDYNVVYLILAYSEPEEREVRI